MKKSRIAKYVFLVYIVLIMGILIFPIDSSAFGNGNPFRRENGYAYTVENYMNDYKNNNGMTYYGTHDWFAERSLMVIYENRFDGQITPNARAFIERLYNINDPLRLRFYYLLGTEAPDVKKARHIKDIDDIILYDCNGKEYGTRPSIGATHSSENGLFDRNRVHGSDHTDLHFNNEGCDEDGLCQDCQGNFANAIYALETERDCQKAVFFLGAIMHIIADAICYPHLLKGRDFDSSLDITSYTVSGQRNSWTARIDYLTCKREALASNEFFNLAKAYDYFGDINLWVDARAISLDTGRFVYENNYHMDLFWAYYNNGPDAYFPIYNNEGKKELFEWDQSTWEGLNSDQTWYFGIIEDMFNKGILSGARVLQLVAERYIDCECNENKKVDDEKIMKPIQTNLKKFFLYIGIVASTSLPFLIVGSLLLGKAKGLLK